MRRRNFNHRLTSCLFLAVVFSAVDGMSVLRNAAAQPATREADAAPPGPPRRERMRERLSRVQEMFGEEQNGGRERGNGQAADPAFAGELRAKRMMKYLEFMQHFVGAVENRYQAIGLSALGIQQMYRKQGRAKELIPIFQELLDNTKDQTERNIYLFLIRQSYQELQDPAKFLELSKQIIRENSSQK